MQSSKSAGDSQGSDSRRTNSSKPRRGIRHKVRFQDENANKKSFFPVFGCPYTLAMMKVPIIDWLPTYSYQLFISDLIAGFTVFVFLVPQGMAYALLAGMPTVYGLYSSTVPLIMYAIVGTSKHLSIGPMAITSLLLGVSCQKFGHADGSPEYIQIAMNVSMLVGLITFILGVCRMGTLANLISHSVLVGFLTASALVIAINQCKYIFGIHVPRFTYTHQTIIYLLSHLNECNENALALGLSSLAILLFVREYKKRNKAALLQPNPTVTTRLISMFLNLSNFLMIIFGALIARVMLTNGREIRVVGEVPSGLKTPSFIFLPFAQVISLIPASLAIAFVAFAGNYAVAVKYASQFQYELDVTQELIGEGFTIIVGVLFNAFIVSGGLARTAVNVESGARTQISGCITAILIIFAVIFFTEFLYYIPMTVLASVIQISIISMVDFQSMYEAYQMDQYDCLVMVMTFLTTLFIGVTEGLFSGIFLSIAVVMKSVAFPQIVHLGRLPSEEGGHYKDITRFPQARQLPGVAIIRMDASLFYGNAIHFKKTAKDAASGYYHTQRNPPIHTLIIDTSAWIDIDLTGVKVLFELKEELMESNHITISIACAKGRIRDRLRACKFMDELGSQHFHMSIDDAVYRRRACQSFDLGWVEAGQEEMLLSPLHQEVRESNQDGSSTLRDDIEENEEVGHTATGSSNSSKNSRSYTRTKKYGHHREYELLQVIKEESQQQQQQQQQQSDGEGEVKNPIIH